MKSWKAKQTDRVRSNEKIRKDRRIRPPVFSTGGARKDNTGSQLQLQNPSAIQVEEEMKKKVFLQKYCTMVARHDLRNLRNHRQQTARRGDKCTRNRKTNREKNERTK
jgi:hypothetical protein